MQERCCCCWPATLSFWYSVTTGIQLPSATVFLFRKVMLVICLLCWRESGHFVNINSLDEIHAKSMSFFVHCSEFSSCLFCPAKHLAHWNFKQSTAHGLPVVFLCTQRYQTTKCSHGNHSSNQNTLNLEDPINIWTTTILHHPVDGRNCPLCALHCLLVLFKVVSA